MIGVPIVMCSGQEDSSIGKAKRDLGLRPQEWTPAAYKTVLEKALCRICLVPTHHSNGTQRQCPRCRKKWSFQRATARWRLIQYFCAGLNARQAASKVGTAYRTAWSLFMGLEQEARHLMDPLATRFIRLRSSHKRIPRNTQHHMLQVYLEIELRLPCRLMRKRREALSAG